MKDKLKSAAGRSTEWHPSPLVRVVIKSFRAPNCGLCFGRYISLHEGWKVERSGARRLEPAWLPSKPISSSRLISQSWNVILLLRGFSCFLFLDKSNNLTKSVSRSSSDSSRDATSTANFPARFPFEHRSDSLPPARVDEGFSRLPDTFPPVQRVPLTKKDVNRYRCPS